MPKTVDVGVGDVLALVVAVLDIPDDLVLVILVPVVVAVVGAAMSNVQPRTVVGKNTGADTEVAVNVFKFTATVQKPVLVAITFAKQKA
jgi:hypothetical protein